ncbi:NADH-quinone oxidoreductase subunit NuoF [Syntrophorhabdus aromaticivorans]|jgi:NADH-quinone oxidoreductase E subunit|uniref:NADH-quinone oxidoreductase subunit NuoF n=2 Tax=Syntrophorhabdus aromaticivorans TaxID=328301 RepID=A0A971S1S1_9BACT|nr:NADH-quinone oxidoreductase subunit NuoF [Syntrophorhabdus aromaticivorans]NLW36513.1 NADH-quinone oxidoreductase subunit NuoF [Syntrophorhabdus aromaticivorans]
MISEQAVREINGLMEKYPRKESALMPILTLVQRDNGNVLTREDLKDVAKLLGVTTGKVYGLATYYTMFNVEKEIGKYHLQVDTNIPATLMGAREILRHLEKVLGVKAGETTKDGLFTLSEVECLASCGTCPTIQVNDRYYENMTTDKVDQLLDSLRKGIMPEKEDGSRFGTVCNVLLKNRGEKNASSLSVAKARGAYQALAKAQGMKPEDILAEVKKAELRGRGGAGFPAGVKWGFLAKDTGKPTYLICNADEGEPGTFKDRQIMEYDPHLLVEGMAITARAIGARQAFIYIRGEFEWIARILEEAVAEAKADGQLPDLDIIVHRGAGSYVCGEETALIESIEGKRGQPRIRPPFPAVAGLYGCPTIVNNVETLSTVPFIIDKGADAFKKWGFENNYGFKLFGISGCVNQPGVYEYPLGVSFGELMEAAGGVKGTLKAAIVGGLSVAVLKAEELKDLTMDYDSCAKHGTALGSGGIMVINEDFSIPELALRTAKFYAHESCGKCVPCREGSHTLVEILKRIVAGSGEAKDIDTILAICSTMRGLTLCPTGEAFSVPIGAMVGKFRNEFEALIRA